MNTAKKNTYDMLNREFTLRVNEPLKKYTAFKVGGPADLFALPKTKTELKQLISRAVELDIPVSLFGGGTNLLVKDKGIRGLVIFTREMKSGIQITHTGQDRTIIQADAGERLASVCRFAIKHSLSGIEFAAGIPGTLGGALMMNAGTPYGNMSDITLSLEILNRRTLAFEILQKPSLDFTYRHLELDHIITGAFMGLQPADSETVKTVYNQHLSAKHQAQPVSAASAGCFFKNPPQAEPAGKLIENAGLKGRKINDAMISDVHANYIINTGQATCKDILMLQEIVQAEIFKKYRITLETEVRIEGED